jgi:hypothetical protein
MSSNEYEFLSNPNLPNREVIITLCNEAGFSDTTGFPLRETGSENIIAWVKYGPNVTVHEARTQDFAAKKVAHIVRSTVQVPRVFEAFQWEHPACTIGCIVMEYVDGSDCKAGDVDDVAKAVQTLTSICGPDLTPGHIGGGYLVHPFFLDWVSLVQYPSVADLQEHINNVSTHKQSQSYTVINNGRMF